MARVRSLPYHMPEPDLDGLVDGTDVCWAQIRPRLDTQQADLTSFTSTRCVEAQRGPGAEPTVMLIGADVSHGRTADAGGLRSAGQMAAEGRPATPSIAAVVASINPGCTRYAARIKDQKPLVEIIEHMEDAVFQLLKVWYKANNRQLPDVLLVFRDGVSEGQFKHVLDLEAKAIKKACNRYQATDTSLPPGTKYDPKITFTTTQKRHIVRFFPDNNSQGDRSGNVRPGTVVDQQICHPKQFDFYMNSHSGIQGTNRPAKYTVLLDEIGFSADSMQLLCYWLCHTFCRCTRSVSMVPPAYYADVAATRGTLYLMREDIDPGNYDSKSMASGSSGDSHGAYRWIFNGVHKNLENTMFFI